jgi:hypothetical protein
MGERAGGELYRLQFADRGSVELKGIPGAWTVYAVDPGSA